MIIQLSNKTNKGVHYWFSYAHPLLEYARYLVCSHDVIAESRIFVWLNNNVHISLKIFHEEYWWKIFHKEFRWLRWNNCHFYPKNHHFEWLYCFCLDCHEKYEIHLGSIFMPPVFRRVYILFPDYFCDLVCFQGFCK